MGSFFVCPEDSSHQSTNAQVCTVCGALIEEVPPAGPAAPSSPATPASSGGACPNCGVPRRSGMLFCENCGVDFATGALDIPDAAPAAAPPPPAPAPAAMSAPAAIAAPAVAVEPPPPLDQAPPTTVLPRSTVVAAPSLEAVVSVDTSPRERPDEAQPPADRHDRIYLLDGDRLLIGRGSTSIHPQIVLRDDGGVSRGHAELIRQKDGHYCVRDLGSSNGTLVNGQLLEDQQLHPLHVGDRLSIGFWHTVTLRDCQ